MPSSLRHVVVTDPRLVGFQYASLRALESEIVRLTGADLVAVPEARLPRFLERRVQHGMRYDFARRLWPKRSFELTADVLWVPLMGPETFELDLFRAWRRRAGLTILYLFDTFEIQLPVLERVLEACAWDLAITSFAPSVPRLERATGRRWDAVPQGVILDDFRPAALAERVIAFSAYGRRLATAHDSVESFCQRAGLYYDFTVAATVQRQIPARALGRAHAWHLGHSLFTFCWPVERTHPERAGSISPITCRWFEAAAAGTIIVGQAPADPSFDSLFGTDLVERIDPDVPDLDELWPALWARREALHAKAVDRRRTHADRWSWESRVLEMLRLARLEAPHPEQTRPCIDG